MLEMIVVPCKIWKNVMVVGSVVQPVALNHESEYPKQAMEY